jgi:hypothetical protein
VAQDNHAIISVSFRGQDTFYSEVDFGCPLSDIRIIIGGRVGRLAVHEVGNSIDELSNIRGHVEVLQNT